MAMKWNWKQFGYGSGAVVAALSTVFALSSDGNETNVNKTFMIKSSPSPVPSTISPPPYFLNKDQLLQDAIQKSQQLCRRIKNEMGLPGLSVGVSVNGKMVWQEGFGFANLENQVRMKPESIMRIASISKSLTMAMMAKLMEEGKVDIDKPIQTYLPTYPEKYVDGEKVTITTRHLLSHISGIRHYDKKETKMANDMNPKDANVDKSSRSQKKKENKSESSAQEKKKKNDNDKDTMAEPEYFFKEKYPTLEAAMKLFQDDELYHKPGSKYLYSTHAWTVVSAVIEKVTEVDFKKYSRRMFDYWGLKNTFLDLHEPIIYNRASYYTRMKDGEIQNSPYVDNSYKWAGGGFLSNVTDLNQFANMLLFSMQTPEGNIKICDKGLPKLPFLKQSTMKKIWTGEPVSFRPDVPDFLYALGFVVGEPMRKCMFCKERDLMTVMHSGAAIGASSTLVMAFPVKSNNDCDDKPNDSDVKGVTVAMITNMTSIPLSKTAQDIANNFRTLI